MAHGSSRAVRSCFVIVVPAMHYINISSNTFSIYKWSKTFSEHTGNDRKHIRVHIFTQETKTTSLSTHALFMIVTASSIKPVCVRFESPNFMQVMVQPQLQPWHLHCLCRCRCCLLAPARPAGRLPGLSLRWGQLRRCPAADVHDILSTADAVHLLVGNEVSCCSPRLEAVHA